MSGLNDHSATVNWLESQLCIIDGFMAELSANSDTDINLLECVEGHRKWLDSELKILQNPEKYRLSGYAKRVVYPLVSNDRAICA